MDDQQETSAYFDAVHDFINERSVLKIVGCCKVLNKSRPQFSFNIIFMIWMLIVCLYMLTMLVYTLSLPNTGPELKVKIFQVLSVMIVAFVVPMINLYYRNNYIAAVEFLKKGFDKYLNEKPDPEHMKFKRQRVRQVRLWSFIFCVLSYLVAIFHVIQPVFKYIFVNIDEENSYESINPYLPLPLHTLFNTKNSIGFTLAFLSNVIYLFLLYTILVCLIEIFLSSTLQFLAQIEILNYSLLNIQSRAWSKCYFDAGFSNHPLNPEEEQELQKSLYLCLRSSVQHHQAILRYHNEVKDYIGAMNTFCLIVFAFLFATAVVPVIKNPLRNMALIFQMMTELTGYFQLFLVGQIIADKSVYTINMLYSTPWIQCNKNYKTMLNIMLTIAKKPIVLRAPFLNADWTLETFGVMLSGGYKLVNLILNTV